jgi:Bifunctional DNA primase/polymerase, N-terminal
VTAPGSSAYDIHAPQLVAHGFFPLAIGPDTKKPQHYVPSLGEFRDTVGWTHPERRPETSPQPDAGIGVRLGRQAVGIHVVALDWDHDEAAITAMDIFLPTVTKEGQRGFTAFYKSVSAVPTRDFRLNGHVAVQVLSDGRQTVVPPSVHPDTKRPYTWTSKHNLYNVPAAELPALPDDYIEKIESILRPLGYEPEPPKTETGNGHDTDGENPFQEMNNLALRNLAAWVPDLNLYRCRRRRGPYASYEAVATWRPSTTGRPTEQRERNLIISGHKGIKDFGTGEGFSPINLVMRARACSRVDAMTWLEERVHPNNGPKVDFEALTGKQKDDRASEEPSQRETKYKFKLIRYKDMRPGVAEQPYLIHELIPAAGLVCVWGPPKCYKSFWRPCVPTGLLARHNVCPWRAYPAYHGFACRVRAQADPSPLCGRHCPSEGQGYEIWQALGARRRTAQNHRHAPR